MDLEAVFGRDSVCLPLEISPGINSYLERVESSAAESNMLHPGRIQVRKSNETEMYKCASPEA
jgi:hypothetical protein